MAASSLQGNVYVTTTLNGLVEIPACILSLFIIDRYGRKRAICCIMILGGLMCLLIPFAAAITKNAVNILALIGKMSISASFTIIYIHSGEIFPTVIRNTGIGVVSVAARVGGMVSPFVLMMGDYVPYLHFIFLGILSLLAGILNTYLPETLGRPMPETIHDVLAMKEKPKFSVVKLEKGYAKLPQEIVEDESEEEYSITDKDTIKLV